MLCLGRERSSILVYCTQINEQGLSKGEIIALTRDHFGRTDPDALLSGFFPVWAVIQFLIACRFTEHETRSHGFIASSSFRFLPGHCYSQSCLLRIGLPNARKRTHQASRIDPKKTNDYFSPSLLFFSR